MGAIPIPWNTGQQLLVAAQMAERINRQKKLDQLRSLGQIGGGAGSLLAARRKRQDDTEALRAAMLTAQAETEAYEEGLGVPAVRSMGEPESDVTAPDQEPSAIPTMPETDMLPSEAAFQGGFAKGMREVGPSLARVAKRGLGWAMGGGDLDALKAAAAKLAARRAGAKIRAEGAKERRGHLTTAFSDLPAGTEVPGEAFGLKGTLKASGGGTSGTSKDFNDAIQFFIGKFHRPPSTPADWDLVGDYLLARRSVSRGMFMGFGPDGTPIIEPSGSAPRGYPRDTERREVAPSREDPGVRPQPAPAAKSRHPTAAKHGITFD